MTTSLHMFELSSLTLQTTVLVTTLCIGIINQSVIIITLLILLHTSKLMSLNK